MTWKTAGFHQVLVLHYGIYTPCCHSIVEVWFVGNSGGWEGDEFGVKSGCGVIIFNVIGFVVVWNNDSRLQFVGFLGGSHC